MATNEERIRLVVDGLNQLDQLKNKLDAATDSLTALENKASLLRRGTQGARTAYRSIAQDAEQELPGAFSTQNNVQQRRNARGRFLKGPGVNARRLAQEQLDFFDSLIGGAGDALRDLSRPGGGARSAALAGWRAKQQAKIQGFVDEQVQAAGNRLDAELRQFSNESVANRASTRVSRGLATIKRVQPTSVGKLNTVDREKTEALLARTEEIRALAEPLRANVAAGKATGSQVRVLQNYAAELESLGEGFREIDRVVKLRTDAFEKARRANERFDRLAKPTEARPGGTVVSGRAALTGGLIGAANAGNFEKFNKLDTALTRLLDRRERESAQATQDLAANKKLSSASVALAQQREKTLAQERDAAIKNAVSSPVRGGVNFPGSPAALEQQRRDALRNGLALPVRGNVTIPGSPAALEADRRAAIRNGVASPLRGGVNFPGSPIAIETELANAKKQELNDTLSRVALGKLRLKAEQAALDATIKNAASSPVRGGAGFPGSPAFLERQAKKQAAADRVALQAVEKSTDSRRKLFTRVTESIGIGGGFPLLFGQGPGAAAGGAIGGGIGAALSETGGFAGGIVGSLLGTYLDKLRQSATATADALRDPIKGFEALAAASFFAGKQQEFLVRQLVEAGRASEAQAIIQQRVIEQIGVGGYNELVALGEASYELSKALGELGVQMQAAIAGPLTNFLKWLRDVAKAASTDQIRLNQEEALRKRLTPAQNEQRSKEISAAYTSGGLFGTAEQFQAKRDAINKRYEQMLPKLSPTTPATMPENLRKEYSAQIAAQDRIEALRREGIDLERAQKQFLLDQEEAIFNLRKRSRDLDIEVVEFRRDVENKIFDKQQENLRKAAELARRQEQLGIGAVDLAAQVANQLPVSAGGGQSQLLAINDQYIKARAEGEADLRQKEINGRLDILDIEQKAKVLAFDIEKKIKDLSDKRISYLRDVKAFELRTQVQIEASQRQAADYALKKYREIYDLMSGLTGNATRQAGARSAFITNPTDRRNYEASFAADEQGRRQAQDIINTIQQSTNRTPEKKAADAQKVLDALRNVLDQNANIRSEIERRQQARTPGQAVPAVGNLPTPGGIGDTSSLFNRLESQEEAAKALRVREMEISMAEEVNNALADRLKLTRETAAVLQQYVQPLIEFNQQLLDSAAYQREYGDLIAKGTLPALAEQLAKLKEVEATQLRLLAIQKTALLTRQKELQAVINNPNIDEATRTDATRRLGVNADTIAGIDATESDIRSRSAGAELEIQKANSPAQRIKDAITDARKELLTLSDPVNQLVTAANSFGDAFGQAFQDIVTGSKSASEAFSDMFSAIGASFAQMAAQMLAQRAVLTILSAFGGGGLGAASAPRIFPAAPRLLAGGGSVSAGEPVVVGDNPDGSFNSTTELFIPGVSGTIVPNDMVVPYSEGKATINPDGSTTYNASYPGAPGAPGSRGASGIGSPGRAGNSPLPALTVPFQKSSAGGSNDPVQQAQAAAAIMQQLGAIDVKYQAEVINETRYVDEAQAQAIGRESAQQGAKMAIAALQNSVGTRRKIGL